MLEKLPEQIPDFTKVFFIHARYLNYVLLAGAIIFVLIAFRSCMTWLQHKRFGGYARCKRLAKQAGTSIDGPLRLITQILIIPAIALLLGLTLLEPQIKKSKLANEYEPAQLVINLDSTISMLAEDVQPSRLLAAKTTISELLVRLRQEGGKDKVGFGRFTDIAIPAVIIPTRDYDQIEHELRLTTSGYIKIFENHGTNIWDAVTQGLNNFNYIEDQERILIIISDGEQVAESDYIDETRKQALDKRFSDPYFSSVKIFLVGIGNSIEKSLIPKEKDDSSNVLEFYTETGEGPDKGKLIQTGPDPAYMEETTSLVNGKFILAENKDALSAAITKILDKERKKIGERTDSQLENISPWFIGATLVLLFLIPFIGIK